MNCANRDIDRLVRALQLRNLHSCLLCHHLAPVVDQQQASSTLSKEEKEEMEKEQVKRQQVHVRKRKKMWKKVSKSSSRSARPSFARAAHTWKSGHLRCLGVARGRRTLRGAWFDKGHISYYLRECGPRVRGRFSLALFAWRAGHFTSSSLLAAWCSVSGSSEEYNKFWILWEMSSGKCFHSAALSRCGYAFMRQSSGLWY